MGQRRMGDVESRQPEDVAAGDMLGVLLRCSAELSCWVAKLRGCCWSLLDRQIDSNRLFGGICSESEMDQMSMFTSR